MWKPIHEARVKAGNALGWYLYRVNSPSGTLVNHDYVTVAIYSSFEATENPFPNELLAKMSGTERSGVHEEDARVARPRSLGTLGDDNDRSRGSARQAGPLPERPVHEGADRRRCGLSRIEKLWKEIRDVRIKEGTLANWGVYGRISGRERLSVQLRDGRRIQPLQGHLRARLPHRAAEGSSGNERQRAGRADQKARDLVRARSGSLSTT